MCGKRFAGTDASARESCCMTRVDRKQGVYAVYAEMTWRAWSAHQPGGAEEMLRTLREIC